MIWEFLHYNEHIQRIKYYKTINHNNIFIKTLFLYFMNTINYVKVT